MIEFGVLLFGLISGNLLMAIGWILLSAYSYIPSEYKTISAFALMIIVGAKKLIKIGVK
jgi:putative Mn2+ efflux pump MntP